MLAAAVPVAAPRWWPWALALLAVAVLVLRARFWGDPLIDPDEQFYLLAGDRLLHGTLPYVDLWDRKPVGLFLLYAAIRLLGGDGIVQYQIVAGCFAAATAIVIAITARRIASPGAALVAGLLYAIILASSGGAGGQSPVFYNLPMALAAWLIVRAIGRDTAAMRRLGAGAMLLVGLAMAIKYSALVEGIYFGCALAWLSWRADPRPMRLAADMASWAGIALLPAALAWFAYAATGHGAAFVYANFVSIGQRGGYDLQWYDLWHTLVRLLPFVIPVVAGIRQRSTTYRFVLGWAAAAILSFAAFGSWFDHYALPLFLPLAILAAPGFAIRRWWIGPVLAAAALAPLLILYLPNAGGIEAYRGDRTHAERVLTAINANLHDGGLYVYYGDPIYYHLTGARLPTRWAFPYHLSLTREAAAIGVDPVAEVTRILDTRPAVILDRAIADTARNPATDAIVAARLRRDYRLVGSFPVRGAADQVWALNTAR